MGVGLFNDTSEYSGLISPVIAALLFTIA